VLLGIAGSPGAGRSTVAAGLAEVLRTRGIPVASVPVAGAIAVEPAARLLVTEGNYLLDESEPRGDVRRVLTEV
jgi:pantothenate kinase